MAIGSAPTLELAPDPRSPGLARDFVTWVLDEWELSRLADTARLLTSELVTNAVLHAGTALTLRVVRDTRRSMVRISVWDASPALPRRKRYSELATTGRGLAMIDNAAQAFGVETMTDGKEIWVELPIPNEPDGRVVDGTSSRGDR